MECGGECEWAWLNWPCEMPDCIAMVKTTLLCAETSANRQSQLGTEQAIGRSAPPECFILLVLSPWCLSVSLFEDPRAYIVLESRLFFSFCWTSSFSILSPLHPHRLKNIHGLIHLFVSVYIQYQSKVGSHRLIQCFNFFLPTLYTEVIQTMKEHRRNRNKLRSVKLK